MDFIISWLTLAECNARCISLICTPEALKERLQREIADGWRSTEIIEKSLSYLPMYELLFTKRIDVSNLSPEQAVAAIAAI